MHYGGQAALSAGEGRQRSCEPAFGAGGVRAPVAAESSVYAVKDRRECSFLGYQARREDRQMKPEKAAALGAREFRTARADFGAAAERFWGRVVLATPLLTDAAFDDEERIISSFSSAADRLEVVINDLGLLHTVKRRYARRVDATLGRVLAHPALDRVVAGTLRCAGRG